jgi:acid ceramidase
MGIMRTILILASIIFGVQGVALPAPFTEHCIVGEKNLYPPAANSSVPLYVVDLDKAPVERWNEISTVYADQIKNLVQAAKQFITAFLGEQLVDQLEKYLGQLIEKFPQPYADELRGIANAAQLPLGDIVLYNIFYEIDTVCTSIVAEDEQGRLYHARNLDFGLFLGWNEKTHDWTITEILRKTIINIEWRKAGKTVFKTVNFAGFIGAYNGVKPQRFTVTANQRFDKDGGFVGIMKWLKGDNSLSWMTLLVREVLETANSYEEAVARFTNTPLMAPVYYIVGGNSSGQAEIVVRAREKTLETVRLNPSTPTGWYILETNYDPSAKPLFIDDRRTPGNQCMQKLGRKNVGFAGIFNVLSSTTNLNKLTAYTTMMQVDTGTVETYIQKCQDPCWAF